MPQCRRKVCRGGSRKTGPFAVGRKNWLFFQTQGGGRTGAILMSLYMRAEGAGLDPQVYFRDLLLHIARENDVANTRSTVRGLTPLSAARPTFRPRVVSVPNT